MMRDPTTSSPAMTARPEAASSGRAAVDAIPVAPSRAVPEKQ
jgi:hypothetical protein